MTTAIILAVGLALVSYLSKKFDLGGSLLGGVLTFVIFMGTGWMGVAVLATFVFFGVLMSRWKRNYKQEIGVAQENEGKRTILNVGANGGVAALCAFLAWYDAEFLVMYELMMVAAVASACSDTFSSELGNVYGKRYFNILTFKKDERGLDGTISWEGLAAGLVGSILIALVFGIFRGFNAFFMTIIIVGLLGNISDSIYGATLQRRQVIDNHGVNLISTLTAAVFAFLIFIFILFKEYFTAT